MKVIKILILLGVICSLFLSGCEFGDPCADKPDASSCYNDLAVTRKNPDYCDKIEDSPKGISLKQYKNDCFNGVALAANNSEYCANIKSSEDPKQKYNCIVGIAKHTVNLYSCRLLTSTQKRDCVKQISPLIKVTHIDTMQANIESKEAQIKNNVDKDFKKELRYDLKVLEQRKTNLYNFAPSSVQRDYFRRERLKILEGIDDPEMKSAISKDYVDYRSANKDASIDELLEKMSELTDQQKLMKKLDEQANSLIDKLKGGAVDYANEKADAALDEIKDQGWKWAKSKMGYDLSKLERLKKKYDKGTALYNSLNDKIEKFKKVYDEVNEVYKKIDKVNNLLAENKIDAGKAEVLKGAVYLGKGLEYATEYVPVFGSTISTITKETFDVTIKLATKRAKRSTSLDKCFEDPANCDVDEISGY